MNELFIPLFIVFTRGQTSVRFAYVIFLICQSFVARSEVDDAAIGETVLQFISSKAPVSESMINPRTTMSLGTRGWVLMVSTVLRTDSGVSLKPSSQ